MALPLSRRVSDPQAGQSSFRPVITVIIHATTTQTPGKASPFFAKFIREKPEQNLEDWNGVAAVRKASTAKP
jgi:hypothetical protein